MGSRRPGPFERLALPSAARARRPGGQAARRPGGQAAKRPGCWPGGASGARRFTAGDRGQATGRSFVGRSLAPVVARARSRPAEPRASACSRCCWGSRALRRELQRVAWRRSPHRPPPPPPPPALSPRPCADCRVRQLSAACVSSRQLASAFVGSRQLSSARVSRFRQLVETPTEVQAGFALHFASPPLPLLHSSSGGGCRHGRASAR